jgi:quercetin dioxygenase-like cupin family protein
VTRPDERRTLYYANGITDILVSPQIRASFSMLESHLEAGASSGDRHLTDSSEQGGYVLEGELTLWLGDDEEPATLKAGDSFQFDSHTRCRYGNLTDQLTRVLWVYT